MHDTSQFIVYSEGTLKIQVSGVYPEASTGTVLSYTDGMLRVFVREYDGRWEGALPKEGDSRLLGPLC